MEKRTVKVGWRDVGIVGMVFAPIGLIFTVLGVVLWQAGAGKDPEDPLLFLCIFGGMGVVFLLMGLGMIMADMGRRRAAQRAVDIGTLVMADVMGVSPVGNVTTHNGNHPWVVECRYQDPDTGVVHVLRSRYLNFNPTGLIEGKQVPVYVDRDGGKYGYYVDIDAVLPQVEIHG